MNEQDYIDYFRELASKHTAIQHTDQKPHFYVMRDDDLGGLNAALGNSGDLRLPALVLDQYLDDLNRENDNFRYTISGGISVLVQCQVSDPTDVRRAQSEARRIALSIINRMFYDCRNPNGSLYGKRLTPSEKFPGEPFPLLKDSTGWGYPFDWTLPTSVALNADDWSDLA